MKRPVFLDKFTEKPSDSLAVYENGIRSFSTNSFNLLCNSLSTQESNRFEKALRGLAHRIQNAGQTHGGMFLPLRSNPNGIHVYVYFLNNRDGKASRFIVQADERDADTAGKPPAPNPQLDSAQIIKKATTLRLSPAFSELVGENLHFKNVLYKAQKAAKSDFPILIFGESGTGKEILARTIHKTSRRKQRKFICNGAKSC